jgi:hypothetical protein
MGEANKQNYKLPDGYEVVQLEAMSAAEKTKAMTEIHALLHNVYGKWADNEKPAEWMKQLEVSGEKPEEGMKLMVSVVRNENKEVVSFTSTEVLVQGDKRYPFAGYSVADINIAKEADPSDPSKTIKIKTPKNAEEYMSVLEASKLSAEDSVKNLTEKLVQKGIDVGPLVQEHKLKDLDKNESSTQKVSAALAAGQVPTAFEYHIPLYPADMKDGKGNTYSVDEAIKTNQEKATLFIAPPATEAAENQSYAEHLRGFADAYMQQHGALNGNGSQADRMRDPFYQDVMKEAARIDREQPGLTYGQAYDINAVESSKRLGLDIELTPEQRKAGQENITNMSAAEQAAFLQSFKIEQDMKAKYMEAGADAEKRAAALASYPALATAYAGEKAFMAELGNFANDRLMQQYRDNAAATIGSGGIDRMQAALDAHRNVVVLPEPTLAQHEMHR